MVKKKKTNLCESTYPDTLVETESRAVVPKGEGEGNQGVTMETVVVLGVPFNCNTPEVHR